jgi:hypothetical protein
VSRVCPDRAPLRQLLKHARHGSAAGLDRLHGPNKDAPVGSIPYHPTGAENSLTVARSWLLRNRFVLRLPGGECCVNPSSERPRKIDQLPHTGDVKVE